MDLNTKVVAVVDDGICDAVEMMDPAVGICSAGERSPEISTVAKGLLVVSSFNCVSFVAVVASSASKFHEYPAESAQSPREAIRVSDGAALVLRIILQKLQLTTPSISARGCGCSCCLFSILPHQSTAMAEQGSTPL